MILPTCIAKPILDERIGLHLIACDIDAIKRLRLWPGWPGVALADPGPLLLVGVALSSLVSNEPAVMLLPHLGSNASEAGVLLALVSTFAGNLLLVGSIASLIVVDLAAKQGIAIDWKQHALTGVPVTPGSRAVVWGWVRWLG